LGDRPTGQAIYTANIVRQLVEVKDPSDRIVVFTGYPEALADCDVELVPIPRLTQPTFGLVGGVWRFLWSQSGLPARVRGGTFDVLYNTTHHGLPYQVGSTAQVLTIQSDVEVTLRFPSQHRLQHLYFRYFLPRLMEASAAVITTSEYASRVLERVYGFRGKLHWAYNGYDDRVFRPSGVASDDVILARYGLRDQSYLLTVNASYPHKNIHVLLDAMERLRASGRPILLCIAGYRSAYLRELLGRASDQLRATIIALPYVPQRDLAALYRGAACLVLPSLHESFGMPCVEAMASGCPLVVANASALPEVCAEAALYVNPSDPAGLSEAIRSVIDDPDVAVQLRASGLQRAQLFSWRATAQRVYEVLHLAATSRSRDGDSLRGPARRPWTERSGP